MTSDPAETGSLHSESISQESVGRDGLLLVAGDGLLTIFAVSRDEVIIGRAPDCDVVIDNAALSRRHVRLRLAPRLTLEDLGSRNGTHVEGLRIEAGHHVPISLGQAFQVGRLSFIAVRLMRSAPRSEGAERAELLRVVDPTERAVGPVVAELARSPLSILVLGETGVGKEVLAETVHRLSGRSGRLVRINCAALSPALIESELFGHEKSAFTGASQARAGLLEAAAGGTVFLDEVGELPEAAQAKLLRAIESREITRVGGVKPTTLDVRFVAATNRDLGDEVTRGRFRRDLYFRLDGVTLFIPPLRESRERIGPLAVQFLKAAVESVEGHGVPRLDAAALARLESHDWPGNVRELKAVVERALVLSRGGGIGVGHLALSSPRKSQAAAADAVPRSPTEMEERQTIIDALEACAGNQTRAAKLLGVSRATLVTKLTIHRIPRPRK